MRSSYEVFYPPLAAPLRLRAASAESAFRFAAEHEDDDPTDFRAKVLKNFILEFNDEVVPLISEMIEEDNVQNVLMELYRSCVLLNPALDADEWFSAVTLSTNHSSASEMDSESTVTPRKKSTKTTQKRTSKQRSQKGEHLKLNAFLKERVIGQDEAVDAIVSAMKRKFADLTDKNKPIGVFLFAGPSGVGKTMLARSLHNYLTDSQYDLVRIDCGEYQHSHEVAKLGGSPPGYTGYEHGGQLSNRILSNPESVVLFDEIEKAHPDFMNALLAILDEGILTDGQGRRILFDKTIIIMTTNLGNGEISKDLSSKGVGFGGKLYKNPTECDLPSRESIIERTNQAINDRFTPEIRNRIGTTIVFNHLTQNNLRDICENEFMQLFEKIATKGYRLVWDEEVIDHIVSIASNPIYGARSISRARVNNIEDKMATLLVSKEYPKGTVFQLVLKNGELNVTTQEG